MKHVRIWFKIFLWITISGFLAVVTIVNPWIIEKPVAVINKFLCENSGKEFLTYTNGENFCAKKFDDAGKNCQFSKECKGFVSKVNLRIKVTAVTTQHRSNAF